MVPSAAFGPGIVTHANSHPNLTAGFVVPLILWRALALRNSRRPVRDGIILGLLATYQVFINEEVLFLTALAGTMFVLIYLAFRPAEARNAVRPVLTGLGTAGILGAVLVAYPLYFQFYGPQHFSGLPVWLEDWPYRLPLQTWVTLPGLSHWGDPASNWKLINTQTEENSFLGWPLVIVTIATVAMLWRRRPAVRALGIVGALFAWASLGNAVVFRNPSQAHPSLSLWRHFSRLPLFDSVLPSRLALVVLPIVGLLIAFAIRECLPLLAGFDGEPLWRIGATVGAVTAVIAAIVAIVPRSVPVAPLPTVPRFYHQRRMETVRPGRRECDVGDAVRRQLDCVHAVGGCCRAGLFGARRLLPRPDGQPKNGDPSQERGQYGPQMRDTERVLGAVGNGSWTLPTNASGYTTEAICDLRYWHTAIIVLDKAQPRVGTIRSSVDRLIGTGKDVDDAVVWDVRWTWKAPVTCSSAPN